MSSFAATHQVQLDNLTISQAIIYDSSSNCAQITRKTPINLAVGLNEVKIQNLPLDLIEDTLRISGTGNAILHDVTVKQQHGDDMFIPERVNLLKTAFESRQAERDRVADKRNLIDKQIGALDKLVEEAGKQTSSNSGFVFNNQTVESLGTLYSYYQKQGQDLREQVRQVDIELREAEKNLNNAREAYDNTGYNNRGSTQYATVVVESTEAAQVELDVIYQVYNVSWTPSYDVRVTTGDEPLLNITYYGNIRQYSGESWNSIPLILSTAKPSRGAQRLPKLGTLEASIYVEEPRRAEYRTMAFAGGYAEAMDAAPVGLFSRKTAVVRKSNVSSEFIIERPATIDNRTDEYKVTVGVINFTAKLSYTTVPSRNKTTFLIANTLNTSEYPLVAGTASIFLDGTFVTKTEIDDVVVNQKLALPLGVDPSLTVEYSPVKEFKQETGDVKKTINQSTEKAIILNNLKSEDVLVTVVEQLPRSADSRIIVTLLTPTAAEGEQPTVPVEGAIITKDNNLEYTVKLAAGEKQTVSVKYTTEYPSSEKVTYNERF